MSKKARSLLGIGLILASLACRFAEQPIPTHEPTLSPDEKLLLEPTLTATPVGPWSCPVAQNQPDPPILMPYGDASSGILRFLNQGGGSDGLRTAYADIGVLATEEHFAEFDFNGDDWLDFAVVLINFETEDLAPPGALFLYQCKGEAFTLVYTTSDLPGVSAPRIHSSADLNLDGTKDLLLGWETCGAHTCFEHFEVLMWVDGRMENRMEGATDDMPSPALQIIQPLGDPAQIEITAMGVNSVGAGPFRQFIRVWVWKEDTQTFQPLKDRVLPSPFRIHYLHDADSFFEAADYEFAIPLYEQIIYDDQLDNWLFADEGRASLSAYAKFKLVLTYLLTSAVGEAEETYLWLQAAHLEGDPGYAFAQLGEAFWSTFIEFEEFDEALREGCLAAQAYGVLHQTEILEQLTYGYANRIYSVEDLCPILP
jgi:hypothetical protein